MIPVKSLQAREPVGFVHSTRKYKFLDVVSPVLIFFEPQRTQRAQSGTVRIAIRTMKSGFYMVMDMTKGNILSSERRID